MGSYPHPRSRPSASRRASQRLGLLLRLVDCYHRLADGPETRRAARQALALDSGLAFSPSFLRRLGLAFVPGRMLRGARGVKSSLLGI